MQVSFPKVFSRNYCLYTLCKEMVEAIGRQRDGSLYQFII
jgi:hypothetical protein